MALRRQVERRERFCTDRLVITSQKKLFQLIPHSLAAEIILTQFRDRPQNGRIITALQVRVNLIENIFWLAYFIFRHTILQRHVRNWR